jgi:DNA-binding NarL/FixJ family response regulator
MGVTILIADDNSRLRTLIRKLLAQEPDLHVVAEAATGTEALRLAYQLRPNIIVMDLAMPEVNGLEALRRIKMDHPETKVIIMTVHTEDVYLRAAEASGTDAFLIKRTLMTTLLPTVRRLLSALSSWPPRTP